MNTQTLPSKRFFTPTPVAIAVSSAMALFVAQAQAETVNLDQIDVVDQVEQEQSYKVEKAASVKYTQPLVDTPKTINIVNEQVLQDQGVTSLEDALRNVSGVSTFGAGEGGGGNVTTADAITIRGFDANGSIYSDGIRDVAGYSRDTFNTEQIEVAKGSNGTVTGKGSAGGSVNLVTKAANLNGDKNSLQASYDQGDTTRLSGDFNKVLDEKSAVRLNIMGQTGGDFWDNGEENYQTLAVAPSYFTLLGDDTDLTVNLMHMQQDNTPVLGMPFDNDAGEPIDEAYWDNFYGLDNVDRSQLEATTLTAIINHGLSDSWALRNQTRFGQTTIESVQSRPLLKDASTVQYYRSSTSTGPSFKTDFSENTMMVNQLDFIGELKTGSVRHDLVVGTEIYQENQKTYGANLTGFSSTLADLETSLANPSLQHSGRVTKGDLTKDATATGIAAYLNNTATLNDQWQLAAGIRAEKYKLEADQTVGRGTSATMVTGSSKADLLSWHTAVNFKPTQNGSIYASLANSQEPNGANLSLSGRSADQVKEYANLDPIEAVTAEIGTKWELFDQKLLLGLAVYQTKKDVYDTVDGALATSGEEENTGVELSVTGQITAEVAITASYTSQDAKVVENTSNPEREGNGLTAAPDESASVWVTYAGEKLTLGAGAEYTSGEEYWRQGAVAFTTGEVTLFNAMAGYQFTDQLSAQINVSNLTDERYVSDYSAWGHFKPGNPRNVKATVKYDF
ncbi:TonB-dependent siderophore receptor [Maribrevibacterium harenarium]|uniref:TonB-dependent siderophore receptor n=1 Tax=Maribrevibacterium harenarium TaxID=2589817 RepID=A0A501WZW5_9GAMM|nr:TonB-dependent siderophore receptor [Maribrevibacterium harenarium]TPE54084.1 TonB-dependent siderophore receptor [Maribrevibacterium harenarium]